MWHDKNGRLFLHKTGKNHYLASPTVSGSPLLYFVISVEKMQIPFTPPMTFFFGSPENHFPNWIEKLDGVRLII
jgi:hypothetical protein